jgi:hypothetical protein
MGFLDRLLGREPQPRSQQWGASPPSGQPYPVPPPRGGASTEDERAIARYRYLLRTAPPEDIEKVHAEAFGQLSPEQRQLVLQRLTEDLPESERPRSDQPADLARSATRAEMRQPGYLQGAFAGRGGMGMGGMFAGSMLGTIAGFVVGSAIADAMLGDYGSSPEAADAGEASGDGGVDAGGDTGADSGGDAGGDLGGDAGGGWDGGDFGGDFGGFGDF